MTRKMADAKVSKHSLRNILRRRLSVRDNQVARHEWVVEKLASLPNNSKILDVGCGEQIYRASCSHLEYYAQDFGGYDGEGSGEGLQSQGWQYGPLDYVGNCWDIKAPDESFDAILCTEVLEHIPYPLETIKEFSRLLKPGGKLIVTAPFSSLPHMQPYYFYSGFSKEFYGYACGMCGLDVEEISANGNSFEYVLQELVRTKQLVRGKVSRSIYSSFIYLFALPIIRFFSPDFRRLDDSLVFGYHVMAVKR